MSDDEQVTVSIYEYNPFHVEETVANPSKEDEEKRAKSTRRWSFCVVLIALLLFSTPFILSMYKNSKERKSMDTVEKALMLNGLRISKQKDRSFSSTAFLFRRFNSLCKDITFCRGTCSKKAASSLVGAPKNKSIRS
jgi:hypothetical protein